MSWKTTQYCTVCGGLDEGENDIHHIYTRKAHPEFENEIWNQMPLCRLHHIEAHKQPISYMAKKYHRFMSWLLDNNWHFWLGKWRNNGK